MAVSKPAPQWVAILKHITKSPGSERGIVCFNMVTEISPSGSFPRCRDIPLSWWLPEGVGIVTRTRRPEVCIKAASLKRKHRRDLSDNYDKVVLEFS